MDVFEHTFATMNTRLSVLVPGLAQREGERLARALSAALQAQEQTMSRFRPDAELFAVNVQAANGPVGVSRSLWSVMMACADHWRRTDGAFDITCASLDGPEGRATFGDVRLDARHRSVAFARRGLALDLGAIGKGVALRRVDQLLRRWRIAHALVSFGESSILTLGPRPCGGDWMIALDVPPTQDGPAPVVSIRDGSLSTSGQAPGRAPIIDPATAHAAPEGRLVSVACKCPIDAEVLSTALLARPAQRSKILARYRPARAFEVALPRRADIQTSRVLWTHG